MSDNRTLTENFHLTYEIQCSCPTQCETITIKLIEWWIFRLCCFTSGIFINGFHFFECFFFEFFLFKLFRLKFLSLLSLLISFDFFIFCSVSLLRSIFCLLLIFCNSSINASLATLAFKSSSLWSFKPSLSSFNSTIPWSRSFISSLWEFILASMRRYAFFRRLQLVLIALNLASNVSFIFANRRIIESPLPISFQDDCYFGSVHCFAFKICLTDKYQTFE